MLLFHKFCLQLVRSIHMWYLSQSYDIVDLYSWMCIYVFSMSKYFLCNKASWENSVTEWFTLYKYILNKKYIFIYIYTYISQTSHTRGILTILVCLHTSKLHWYVGRMISMLIEWYCRSIVPFTSVNVVFEIYYFPIFICGLDENLSSTHWC